MYGLQLSLGLSLNTDSFSCGSVLKNADKFLNLHTDHQKAVSWALPFHMRGYRSVVDSLVAHTFPELKLHVKRFYKHGGKSMEDMFTEEQILEYDLQLCRVLAAVFILWNARGEIKKGFRQSIDLDHLNKSLK